VAMLLINSIDEIKRDLNSAITIGTFDGLHIAHQAIIRKTREIARINSGRSVIITFDPHPRKVIDGVNSPKMLMTLDEKIEMIEKLGITVDLLLVIPFTKEFSKLSSEYFFKEILFNKIGFNNLIIGYDHFFGKNREGNVEFLKRMKEKFPFNLSIVDKIVIDDSVVNSTRIRNFLLNGEIVKANKLLGWNYFLSGRVIKGDMRGRQLGFPTANLKINNTDKLIPKNGVYFIKIFLDKKQYFGFLNIGFRPTFVESKDIFIEAHIFDFNENIYDKEIKIEFIEFLREEQKFNSAEELTNQLKIDKNKCFEILNNKNNLK